MARVASFSALAVALAVVCSTRSAAAFEREWHLGGGLGAAAANGYATGPAANLYAAYGVSDVFDLRVELVGSRHAQVPDPAFIYGAKLALAYKIDVIQWIPYVGLTGGFLGVEHAIEPFSRVQPSAGMIFGLDYAMTRNFGLGGAVSYEYAFHPGGAYASALLRAEYRFGW